MLQVYLLTESLGYIEENLTEPLSPESIAQSCFCSVSTLQKLFRYALRLGVMDYIARRRLTQAAHDLLGTKRRVMDIAMAYQYQSPEVFVRAFRRLWGVTPTVFRQTWKFAGLFPRITGIALEGESGMTRKKVDITELYEVLRGLSETYVLCFDIVGLLPINEISHDAGDLAIVESLKRIDEAATEDMLLFRIGGDEFALVTGFQSAEQAEAVARRALAKNGQPIWFSGREIPLSLRAGGVRIAGKALRYSELFEMLNHAQRSAWQNGVELLML